MSTQQRSYDEEVAAWERDSVIVDDPNSIYQQEPDFPQPSEEELKDYYKRFERERDYFEKQLIGDAFPFRPPTDQPMFRFSSYRSGEPMDYEYIVEGMLRFGHNAWSGPRGVGKTSTLIPMLCAIAGLIPHYPLHIKLRRQVILVTEDEEQVWMVIRAMIADGYLNVPEEELNDWFHVAPASRLTTSEIIAHAEGLELMKAANERADGTPFPAGPLLVMDTVSACIDTENGSSNDEVARDVELIKQKLRCAAVLLIGHTAKDAGTKAGQTFLGAQAWEANTIGAVTLRKPENGDRELVVLKNRFSADSPRFRIVPKTARFSGKDVLGNDTVIQCLYNLIEPMTTEQVEAATLEERMAKEAIKLEEDSATLLATLEKMLADTDSNGDPVHPTGVKRGDLYKALTGKDARWKPVIDGLADDEDSELTVKKAGKTEFVNLIVKS
ncbi:AAA family ATPase [Luminiphilus sp.]|nr:AAA family ATPase [Luminiphilus sp.]